MLEPLGLGSLDEAVYRALLRSPSAPTTQIARELKVDRRRVRTALSRLAEIGLVDAADPTGGAAVDPGVAMRALVRRRRADLDAVVVAVDDLVSEYRSGSFAAAPERVVEVVSGREHVLQRTRDLAHATETEILVFDTPPYASDLANEVGRESSRLRRGVRVLSLYSAAALEVPERLSHVRALIAAGEEARVLPSLPLKLHLYDRRTAVVPLVSNSRAADSVAIVHESGLLDALLALFDKLWTSAPRLDAPRVRSPLDDADRALLGLLAAGVKDDAIARQMGLSVRTARRRISDRLRRLHATSRFQAGVEAHRRGWLP